MWAKKMASQRDPNRVAIMSYVPIPLAAKIRTHIAGKTVPNKVRSGRKVRKPTRAMGMSDYLIGLAEQDLADVKVRSIDREWAKMVLEKNQAIRRVQDAQIAREHRGEE